MPPAYFHGRTILGLPGKIGNANTKPPTKVVCEFRGVEFFQFLYAGDNLDHSQWDPRSLAGDLRLDDKEKIALLDFELACKIEDVNHEQVN